MSLEQSCLTDHRQPVAGQEGADASAWQPRRDGRCVCGARVDAEAARVVGVEGVVPACSHCWQCPTGKDRYASTTAVVVAFNRDSGYRDPAAEIDADAHPQVVSADD
jgi:hypothetical protein